MIELTRLNGEHMVVNSDLIRYAEAESGYCDHVGDGRQNRRHRVDQRVN